MGCPTCHKDKELFCCRDCYDKLLCEITQRIIEGQSYDRVNKDIRNLGWKIETLTKAVNTLIPKKENKVEMDQDEFT